jgi:hypothetical protein
MNAQLHLASQWPLHRLRPGATDTTAHTTGHTTAHTTSTMVLSWNHRALLGGTLAWGDVCLAGQSVDHSERLRSCVPTRMAMHVGLFFGLEAEERGSFGLFF